MNGGPAPLLVENGNIHTLDRERPRASALLAIDGKVRALGSERELRSLAPRGARVLDLAGATVLPGLIDAHGHLLSLGESMSWLDLRGARNLGEAVERVRRAAAARPGPGWIVGRGWDPSAWPEDEREPSHALLSAALPDRPVFLERIDGHAAWVNRVALRAARLDRESGDPPGGRLIRDARGEPSGVLIDVAAWAVKKLLPAPTEDEREQMLLQAARACVGWGLVEIHDAAVDAPSWAAMRRLAEQGRWPLRVYAMFEASDPALEQALAQGPKRELFDRLTLRAVKIFLDGALGSRGAALFEDYADDAGNRGLDLFSAQDLKARAEELMRRGFQVAVHAIGDRANALALSALGEAARASGAVDARPRVEHAQLLRFEDLGRFAASGIIASMQPSHAIADMAWAEQRLGTERLKGAYAWRSLLSSGARLAFGSDFPVQSPSPLLGLYAACTRRDARGEPAGGWLPEQRLSREQAIRAYTEGSAFAAFEESVAGRLAPGFRADFSAFDRDLLEVPPEELLSAQPLITTVGGEVVFGRDAVR